jgi:hypothetical protein
MSDRIGSAVIRKRCFSSIKARTLGSMSSFQHVVPPAMLLQIGDMTVSFGHLEFQMQEILVYLVNQSAIIGRVLGSYLSFSNLRASVSTLYEERFDADELFLELKDLLKEAASIEQERNAITHSYWIGGKTPLTITRHGSSGN